jgi:hypothetical protein
MVEVPESPEVFSSKLHFDQRVEETGYKQLMATILKSTNSVIKSILSG